MKKLLTLMLFMTVIIMNATAGKVVYLKPSANWSQDGARFALYMYEGNNNAWVDFSAVENAEGIYQAVFDDVYTNMIFCRMNGSTAENSWDNKWNQTSDLAAPESTNLLYTLEDGFWDGASVGNGITFMPYFEEPVVIESMSIVGDLTGGWPDNETNDWSMAKAMTKSADNEAVWTLTLTDVELEAKAYYYKAVANQKWGDYELPETGNNEYVINEAGKYTLTFTANTEEHTLTLVAEKQQVIPEPVVIESMSIVGDLTGGWPDNETNDWSMAKAMTKSADNDAVWTLTLTDVELEAKAYYYKAVANQKWGDYELPETGNNEYVINEAGKYTLTFTANTEEHTLTLVAEKQQVIPEPVVIESMSIVGDLTGGWPDNETNDWSMAKAMTRSADNDAVWTLTLTDVELEAKAYYYKAVANQKWGDYELPETGNNEYVINEAGKYTLTFTANTEEHTLTLVAEKQQVIPEPVVIESMSIVGDLTGGWPDNETNDWSMAKAMTKSADSDAVWTLTLTDVELEAKAYYYKAVANQKWGDYELPETGNNEYVINEAGKYTLTFTANTEEHTLTLVAEKQQVIPEPVVIESMSIVGDLTGGWPDNETNDWSMAKAMTKSADNDAVWTLTLTDVELEAKAYYYKAVANQKWGDYELPETGNNEYVINEAGKYTLTFTANTEEHTLTLVAEKQQVIPEPVVIESMSIVGDLTSGWPDNETNDWSMAKAMTKSADNDAVWTLTLTDVELEAKAYYYKAVANQKWGDYELPETGNNEYVINEAGKYTLTFTANTEEHTLTLVAEKQQVIPEPVVIESMSIVGDLTGGWPDNETNDWSMAKAMTRSADNDAVWTLTLTDVELEAKAYYYKAVANQKWGDYELPETGNNEYVINEAGKYTLNFTANTEEHTLTLVAEKQQVIPEPVVIESMSIVGDLTGGWPDNETNDWSMAKAMTKSADSDAVWTLTLTDVELEAKAYYYKAVANQKWGDYELPETGNNEYVINEAGKYTLTFTANTEEHTLTLVAEKQQVIPEPVVIESMSIVGDLTGGWPDNETNDWSMAKAMTKSADNDAVWTLTLTDVEVEAKTYEYKAVANQKWGDYELPEIGNADFVFGTEEYPAGKYTLTFTANTEEHTLTLVAEKQQVIPEPVVIESMSIVGDLTGGWPNDETNDWSMAKAMTRSADNDAVWTLTLTDVEVEAKTYEYKAVANQKWGEYELPEIGNANFVFGTEEYPAGKYTLTFTANTEEHTLTLVAEKQQVIPEPVVIESMSIVGDLTGGWPNDETNDWSMAKAMTKSADSDAVWTLTLTDVEVEAKTYEYKAVANQKWGDYELPEIGNANFVFGTEEYPAGKYTLTFTANTEEHTLTLVAEKQQVIPEPVVIESMSIVGDLTGGWPDNETNDWSMAKAMTKSADNDAVWTLTLTDVEVEAKTYEYKAVANQKWGEYELPEIGNANFVFGTEEYPAGKYTLTFTANTEEHTLTLVAEKQQVIPEITKVELRGDWNWESTEGMTKSGENTWTMTLDLTATDTDQQFKLCINDEYWIGNGSNTLFDAPEGWISGQEEGDWNWILKNSTTGFQTYTVTATWLPNENAAVNWTLKFEGKDERQGEGLSSVKTADGQPAVIFDLQGRRITTSHQKKGLYIVNGKKVSVK